MAPKTWTVLVAAAALAACGGGASKEQAADSAKVAQMRVRNDSVRKARQAQDSLVLAQFTACRDSVTTAMAKTKAGRRTLAKPLPAGQVLPEVQAACTPKSPVASAPAAATAAPAAAAGQTPAQKALAAKDSARTAAEAKKAEHQRETARKTMADSLKLAQADSTRADSLRRLRETEVLRETYAYGGGARDPFRSVVREKGVGPELVDLQLVGILEDVRASARSVATFRDKRTGKRYTARTGDQLGRNRVMQIRGKDVTFSVFDFGVERRETLTLRKQEDVTP